MKTSAKFALVSLILATTLSAPVYAWHGGHGGGHSWGWGRVAVGATVIGSAAYLSSYPYGYRSPYAYSYPYAYPYPAPVYVEPTYVQSPAYVQPQAQYAPPPQAAAPAAPAAGSWYYCRKSKSYYPYVQTCAAGWENVPATPPRP